LPVDRNVILVCILIFAPFVTTDSSLKPPLMTTRLKNLCFLLCLLFSLPSSSQFKEIARSEEFNEPKANIARIIPMRDGTTAFIQADPRGILSLSLYDADHKLAVQKEIKPSYGKIKGHVNQLLEINGDIVVTASDWKKKKPFFYRILIDGKTGAVKDEKIVLQLNSISHASAYGVAFDEVPMSGFQLRVSDDHEYYAIIGSGDADEGFDIIASVYDKNHQEVSKTNMSMVKPYNYIEMLDYALDNKGNLYIACGGYKTKNKRSEEDFFLTFTKLVKGHHGPLTPREVNIPGDLRINGGIIGYNAVVDKFVLLAYSTEQVVYSSYLDANTLTLSAPFNTTIDPGYMSRLKEETGIDEIPIEPQQLLIMDDGSILILRKKSKYSSGGSFQQTDYINLLISQYDRNGELKNHYLIPTMSTRGGRWPGYFYNADQAGKATWMGSSGFEKLVIVPGKKNHYLLLNELPENLERIKRKEKIKKSGPLSNCNAIVYSLSGNKPIPENHPFIPTTTDEKNLGMFCIGAASLQQNSYVTMVLEIKAKSKKARLIWFQYE
jgi:hypothetical protein